MSGRELPADTRGVDVVVVGSANLDLVVRSPRIPRPGETLIGSSFAEYPGGKGLNQAVAAARSGARVAFLGALGDDDAGRHLRRVADDAGIDTSAVTVLAGQPTGRALITVGDDSGENTIVVVPGANSAVRVGEVPDCRVVLAQLEVPVDVVIAAFAAAKRGRATTILNPAPAIALPPELLAVTDVIVPNEHEIELVGGLTALLDAGLSTVIVTRGAAGVDVATAEHRSPTSHPALAVEPVDTTGAGDSFCGALAARLARDTPLDDAIRWAIVAGGLATTAHGAIPSIPDSAAIAARVSG